MDPNCSRGWYKQSQGCLAASSPRATTCNCSAPSGWTDGRRWCGDRTGWGSRDHKSHHNRRTSTPHTGQAVLVTIRFLHADQGVSAPYSSTCRYEIGVNSSGGSKKVTQYLLLLGPSPSLAKCIQRGSRGVGSSQGKGGQIRTRWIRQRLHHKLRDNQECGKGAD